METTTKRSSTQLTMVLLWSLPTLQLLTLQMQQQWQTVTWSTQRSCVKWNIWVGGLISPHLSILRKVNKMINSGPLLKTSTKLRPTPMPLHWEREGKWLVPCSCMQCLNLHLMEKRVEGDGEHHHFVEPKMFCTAFDHPDPVQHERWCTAIHKEFCDMNNQGIWHKVKWAQVLARQHCIKCKRVLKIKRDGVFCACLVACEIPSLDFSEQHMPVINDTAWWILLLAKLMWEPDASLIDIDTAFLYRVLEEEIYMDLPKGLTAFDSKCLLLLKALFRLVQGAWQWHKKFIAILKKIGFQGRNVDIYAYLTREAQMVLWWYQSTWMTTSA